MVTCVVTVGEAMVELWEEASGTVHQSFGGDALNVAVYLARAAPEVRVMLGSAIGDDDMSGALVELCTLEGVDTSHLARVPRTRIGTYLVRVDDAGERTFEDRRSHSPFRGSLDAGDDLLPDPARVDLLWFSGITLAVLHDLGRERLLGYAGSVRGVGGQVAYDPNYRPTLWGDVEEARRWAIRAASSADIVLASVDDGRQLMDRTGARAVTDAFLEMGAKEVVVTDGPAPCVLSSNGRVEEMPSIVANAVVVDTTAAGDAFDAGYLSRRVHGADPSSCAIAGHRLAARVVAHRGAIIPAERSS